MAEEIELLSPAGNIIALHAAVQSGADAVYIGGPCFNARQSAKNFTIEDIKEQAKYCHLYGVDLHVAVNTLIKEKELGALLDYVKELNNAGADALIIQDPGAARLIKNMYPDIALHASTQMTVTSVEGVKYLEDMGFSRVVLARELSAYEIDNIVKNTNAEIEVFVHGAICMCYSGQCLMSSIIGGRSANRGRCAQPCRLNYTLTDGKNTNINAYALSPKDLALIDELKTLKEIGVKSLKIEGRLKRAEYVSAVTGIYRKYLDNTQNVSQKDMEELSDAFSRSGFTEGYFKNQLGQKMMSHKNPSNASDNVFSKEAKERAKEDANIRKIPVYISASLLDGEPLTVTMYDDDKNVVTVTGEVNAEKANNKPLDRDRLLEQLEKLGSTPFVSENTEIEIDNGITVPIKEINNIRRKACGELIKKRSERDKKRVIDTKYYKDKTLKNTTPKITAECTTYEQAKTCLDMGIDIVFTDSEIAAKDNRIIQKASDIFTDEEIKSDAVMVSSPAHIYAYGDRKLYGNFRLNVYNSETADIFSDMEYVTISPELNLHEIRDITERTKAKCELIAYGRLELMLMKNCPIKALGKCQSKKTTYSLRDRKNEEFPIICKNDCKAALINSKPIYMADKMEDIMSVNPDAIRLIFTVEDKSDTERIISEYKKALTGEKAENIFGNNEFTRGHYYRGVE